MQKFVPVVVLLCNPCAVEQTSAEILGRLWAKMATAVVVFDIFSGHRVSLLIAFLSLVAVFVYIPFVSDYTYWFLMAAYVIIAAHR